MALNNIPLFKVWMNPRAKEEVAKVVDSGYIGQGAKVDEFEDQLRQYLGVKHLVTLNSGTSGLHLALHMLKQSYAFADGYSSVQWPGLTSDDEVLTTSLTCTATNFPILANGFNIKWVDLDPTTLNMDLDDLERKLSPKTKVIIAMHWGGYPLDLDRLQRIKKKCKDQFGFEPAIIQDCAHAMGSLYKNKSLATYGDLAMYSLQAIKHITSVDGGVLVVPPHLNKRARLLRWYGIDRDEKGRTDFRCEADITEWGFKFHMNDVCATIGMTNLQDADYIVGAHKSNAKYYDANLSGISGLTTLTRHPERDSAFWIYSMLVDDRPGFYRWMKECNITVSQVHERNDKHSGLQHFKTELPVLDRTIGKVVSIPVGWWVTEEQREYIVGCIKKGW